jgi:hypothetical protein
MAGRPDVCLHCGRRVRWLAGRGLCPRCYRCPGVRDNYPCLPRARRTGRRLEPEPPPPTRQPAEPTAVVPGPERVAVLAGRVARGEFLWHPQDAGRSLS